MSAVTFRENSQDAAIWAEVFERNEYRLPASIARSIVLDIGCNIGAFCSLAKSRGANEMWGVEADFANLQMAMDNVAATTGHGTFHPIHAAAWRSDRRGDRLKFNAPHISHTGCGVVSVNGDYEVPVMEFDLLLKLITDHGTRRLNWLKIDCEGSEWPILFTSRGLHLIDNIVGEYHAGVIPGLPPESRVDGVDYSLDTLAAYLTEKGFAVEILPPNWDQFNLFFAHRVRFGKP